MLPLDARHGCTCRTLWRSGLLSLLLLLLLPLLLLLLRIVHLQLWLRSVGRVADMVAPTHAWKQHLRCEKARPPLIRKTFSKNVAAFQISTGG